MPAATIKVFLPHGDAKWPRIAEISNWTGKGLRTPNGFVVLEGSHAVPKERPSAAKQHPGYLALRKQMVADGRLVLDENAYRFTRDVEFSSPSAAAAVVHGGGTNGPLSWHSEEGVTLRELENQAQTS